MVGIAGKVYKQKYMKALKMQHEIVNLRVHACITTLPCLLIQNLIYLYERCRRMEGRSKEGYKQQGKATTQGSHFPKEK